MGKENYAKIKKQEMNKARKTIESFKNSDNKFLRFPNQRPIVDLKQMVESSVKLFSSKTAYLQKFSKNADYTEITYQEAYNDINALGTRLIDLGFKDEKIGICGENTYHWAISYLAIVCGVGVVVPLDKELSSNELEQLIKISNLSAVICSKKQASKIEEIKKNGSTNLKSIILMNDYIPEQFGNGSLAVNSLIKEGTDLINQGDSRYIDAEILGEDIAALLFTSGTTGIAKGVMITHKNFAENLMAAPTLFDCTSKDSFLSVLPLHHTYECTCGMLMSFYEGCSYGFCQGLKYLQKELTQIKPTIFLSVPLILESFYKKIQKNIIAQNKEKAIKRAISVNNFTKKIGIDLSNKFFSSIHKIFGGRLKCFIVGGAAINPSILQFFKDIGFNALQGYGLTECSPMAALNPDIAPKNESCGIPIPGISIKIEGKDADGIGEICIKGPNVMLGYYQNKEATDKVLIDGWYYSGDLGYMDDENYIYITGRKKNVIITKNGKNVFPEELEYYLDQIPIISESMVWSDEAKKGEDVTIVASIFPNQEIIEEKLGETPNSKEIEKMLWEEIDKINETLPFFKKIKKIHIRKEEFEKTTSKKIKRFVKENRG